MLKNTYDKKSNSCRLWKDLQIMYNFSKDIPTSLSIKFLGKNNCELCNFYFLQKNPVLFILCSKTFSLSQDFNIVSEFLKVNAACLINLYSNCSKVATFWKVDTLPHSIKTPIIIYFLKNAIFAIFSTNCQFILKCLDELTRSVVEVSNSFLHVQDRCRCFK